MSLRPYPTELPREALALVWQAFAGQPVDMPKAVHAAYETIGYTLGKALPVEDAPIVIGRSLDPSESLSPEDSEVQLTFAAAEQELSGEMVVARSSGPVAAALSPVWMLVIKVALMVIQRRFE